MWGFGSYGEPNLCVGAGAPSPPSEEGGGTAYKGLKRRDGRRDTPSVCESSRYRRALNNNDTCIILCTPTSWCKQQPRVLSPSVGLLKSLMQSDSSLLRGSRGGSAAEHRIAKARAAVKPAAGGLPSSAAGGSLRFAAVALSFQNVPARRAHLHFSCARRARFMCRRHASCAEGALHLRSKKIPPFDKSKDGNKSRGTTFVGNAQSSSCPVTAASRPILLAPGRFPSAAWE